MGGKDKTLVIIVAMVTLLALTMTGFDQMTILRLGVAAKETQNAKTPAANHTSDSNNEQIGWSKNKGVNRTVE